MISLFNLYRFCFFVLNRLKFKTLNLGGYVRSPMKIIGKKYIALGKSVIESGARIEAISKYGNEKFTPEIVIEDGVMIQQNLHMTCAKSIVISKGTSITPNVGIFDIIHPYNDIKVNPREQSIQTHEVFIGENCLIGMNSVILPGTKLGNHCIVGACSVVSGSFPAYSVIVGSPAKIIKRYRFETKNWEKTTSEGKFIKL